MHMILRTEKETTLQEDPLRLCNLTTQYYLLIPIGLRNLSKLPFCPFEIENFNRIKVASINILLRLINTEHLPTITWPSHNGYWKEITYLYLFLTLVKSEIMNSEDKWCYLKTFCWGTSHEALFGKWEKKKWRKIVYNQSISKSVHGIGIATHANYDERWLANLLCTVVTMTWKE